jgi:hypothetical protein
LSRSPVTDRAWDTWREMSEDIAWRCLGLEEANRKIRLHAIMICGLAYSPSVDVLGRFRTGFSDDFLLAAAVSTMLALSLPFLSSSSLSTTELLLNGFPSHRTSK